MNTVQISREWVCTQLPAPQKNAHKGTHGTLHILAGSHRYRGAAILCAGAALRAGAGLVRLVGTNEVCTAAIAALPCLILEPVPAGVAGGPGQDAANALLSGKPTAILAGCGMGATAETSLLVRHMLQNTPCPLVLDADALNCLAGYIGGREDTRRRTALLALLGTRQAPTVLTPHIGEMARLYGLPAGDIARRQTEVALDFAKRYNCVVVLKNNTTTIAAPGGQVYQNNSTGNPGLATGGSGDVLAGILGSLLARGMQPAEAAACAVWLHAAAADLLAETTGFAGLSPADLPMCLAKLLHSMGR